MKVINETLKSKLDSARSESNNPGVVALHIMQNCTVYELEDLIAYLIDRYEQSPKLLHMFHNDKSDNCLLEASEQEKQELAFESYVITNLLK